MTKKPDGSGGSKKEDLSQRDLENIKGGMLPREGGAGGSGATSTMDYSDRTMKDEGDYS